jgi:hypothetical protein
MKLTINRGEANIIQVALDHLYEEHANIMANAILTQDYYQSNESYYIQRIIEDLQGEIICKLKSNKYD